VDHMKYEYVDTAIVKK